MALDRPTILEGKRGVPQYPDAEVVTLGLESNDGDAKYLLRRALRDAWPSARRLGWRLSEVHELAPQEAEVGYTSEDGIIFIKLRDPSKGGFYPYSFVLATLLHEMSHLSVLGHGKGFYRKLVETIDNCGADPALRREIRQHICAEMLNAVCDNDARRAKGILSAFPEAATCRCKRPGAKTAQLPLEYAAHHGRVALTKLLLEARADIAGSAADGGMPPLLRAAAQGNARTTAVLLEAAEKMAGKPKAASAPAVIAQVGKANMTFVAEAASKPSATLDSFTQAPPVLRFPPPLTEAVQGPSRRQRKRRGRSSSSACAHRGQDVVQTSVAKRSVSLPALQRQTGAGESQRILIPGRGVMLCGSFAV